LDPSFRPVFPFEKQNPDFPRENYVMKKSIQKLTLSKETLRNLTEEQMQDIAGGNNSKVYSECPDKSCGIACTYVGC
jgi:natural product precursor